MKRFALAVVLALGLFAATGSRASASGFGFGNGEGFGISPGSISFGVGFNLSWSGMSAGHLGGGCGQTPCYGPPAMYNAYGQGHGYDYGYGDWSGYYGGGYPAYGYGAYNGAYGYQGGYYYQPNQQLPAPTPAGNAQPNPKDKK